MTFVSCADVRFDQRLQIQRRVGISRDKGVGVRTDTTLAVSRCCLHRSGIVCHLACSEVFPLLFAPQTYFPGPFHRSHSVSCRILHKSNRFLNIDKEVRPYFYHGYWSLTVFNIGTGAMGYVCGIFTCYSYCWITEIIQICHPVILFDPWSDPTACLWLSAQEVPRSRHPFSQLRSVATFMQPVRFIQVGEE